MVSSAWRGLSLVWLIATVLCVAYPFVNTRRLLCLLCLACPWIGIGIGIYFLYKIIKNNRIDDVEKQKIIQDGKTVQVYMPVKTAKTKHGSTTEKFAKALQPFLKRWSYSCAIKSLDTLRSDLPLIVICPFTERFELNYDAALQKLNRTSDFLVLVLHCGTNTPRPYVSTVSKLTDKTEKYPHAIFIDMAFTENCKLNDYELNKSAMIAMKSFLQNKRHKNKNDKKPAKIST